ncbi:PilZ domain-containing protein [Bradyrhizobium cytisi]|uniref:PilZ domain-containing protein n=1 Tax=Bradyrhizobium cytisi TaxID=515489 RepID=A0A5S4WC30_9BRAD|nr:PilZ domain-containing protein [Bradyrhizobium cytisi]TYL72075.1 PilZ domain-containing protein [Bradyrhizobium cytisi]
MLERRTLERIELNQLALVHVDGVRGVHPCLVMNLHGDGAKLHSSTHHTVAHKFALSLDGFNTTRYCRVVWRDGNTCGVKFVDRGGALDERANRVNA